MLAASGWTRALTLLQGIRLSHHRSRVRPVEVRGGHGAHCNLQVLCHSVKPAASQVEFMSPEVREHQVGDPG